MTDNWNVYMKWKSVKICPENVIKETFFSFTIIETTLFSQHSLYRKGMMEKNIYIVLLGIYIFLVSSTSITSTTSLPAPASLWLYYLSYDLLMKLNLFYFPSAFFLDRIADDDYYRHDDHDVIFVPLASTGRRYVLKANNFK